MPQHELVVATTNQGKLREIRELLKDLPYKVISLSDYPGAPAVVEDGKTFRSNAAKKAVTIAKFTGRWAIGEDSGLEVKALDWQPGIYSARFSGPGATDEKNNRKLLQSLRDVPLPQRRARYRCVAVLSDPAGKVMGFSDGRCEGVIAFRRRGKNGFGYDPLFIIPRYGKTFGELDSSIKSQISHRAKALKKMKVILRSCLSRGK